MRDEEEKQDIPQEKNQNRRIYDSYEQATAIVVTILMDYGTMNHEDLMAEFRVVNGMKSWYSSMLSELGPFRDFIKNNHRFEMIQNEMTSFSVRLKGRSHSERTQLTPNGATDADSDSSTKPERKSGSKMETERNSVEQQMRAISDLWGISLNDVQSKLVLLQSLISDASDSKLLDLLNRADLQIEAAVNLYYEQQVDKQTPWKDVKRDFQPTSNGVKCHLNETTTTTSNRKRTRPDLDVDTTSTSKTKQSSDSNHDNMATNTNSHSNACDTSISSNSSMINNADTFDNRPIPRKKRRIILTK